MRVGTLILTGAAMLGCAGPEGQPAPDPDVATETAGLASSLEIGVTRDGVRMTFHVTNTTAEPVAFTFPTSQRYDFMVEDAAGERRWQWSSDRAFQQVITEDVLEAGETWTVSEVWDPAGRSGSHVGIGRLTAQERPVERRAAFELP